MNWQPPENRQCIGERARREVANEGLEALKRLFMNEYGSVSFLQYADHLFSMTQTLLLRFCSNEAQEMEMCL